MPERGFPWGKTGGVIGPTGKGGSGGPPDFKGGAPWFSGNWRGGFFQPWADRPILVLGWLAGLAPGRENPGPEIGGEHREN